MFAKRGESADLQPDLLTTIESFVCCMYGNRKVCLVNEARYKLFQQRYAPKNQSQPLDKIKGTDASNVPPCSSVLLQKIKRSNLVTAMWKNAITSDSYTWCPEENGWVLAESRYAIKWFVGLQVPRDVCNNIDAVCQPLAARSQHVIFAYDQVVRPHRSYRLSGGLPRGKPRSRHMWICPQLSGARGVDNGGVRAKYESRHSQISLELVISLSLMRILGVRA